MWKGTLQGSGEALRMEKIGTVQIVAQKRLNVIQYFGHSLQTGLESLMREQLVQRRSAGVFPNQYAEVSTKE
jgi:hypothetical protein